MFRLFGKKKAKTRQEESNKKTQTTVVETEKNEKKASTESSQSIEANASEIKKDESSNTVSRKMPYHITKHPNGGWQIKRGKGKKALKLFDTQKDAIEYAKVLEKEKGESYIIHKANGTTRKKTY